MSMLANPFKRKITPVAPPQTADEFPEAYARLVVNKIAEFHGVKASPKPRRFYNIRPEPGLLEPPNPKRTKIPDTSEIPGIVKDALVDAYYAEDPNAIKMTLMDGQTVSVNPADMAAPLGMTRMLRGTKVFHGYKRKLSSNATMRVQREAEHYIAKLVDMIPKTINPFERRDIVRNALSDSLVEAGLRSKRVGAQTNIIPTDLRKAIEVRLNSSDKDAFRSAVLNDKAYTLVKTTQNVRANVGYEDVFKHHDFELAGKGAGGNLYGKGIYLSGSPRVAQSPGYAGGRSAVERGEGVIRQHNIPPQAKILDVHKPRTYDELEAFVKKSKKVGRVGDVLEEAFTRFDTDPQAGYAFEDLFEAAGIPKYRVGEFVPNMGYDGISFDAGKATGTKWRGKPKNYVIYNYDVINNPRKFVEERAGKSLKRIVEDSLIK